MPSEARALTLCHLLAIPPGPAHWTYTCIIAHLPKVTWYLHGIGLAAMTRRVPCCEPHSLAHRVASKQGKKGKKKKEHFFLPFPLLWDGQKKFVPPIELFRRSVLIHHRKDTAFPTDMITKLPAEAGHASSICFELVGRRFLYEQYDRIVIPGRPYTVSLKTVLHSLFLFFYYDGLR